MSYTAQHLYFEDVEVGQSWETLARTVTQADIVNFAGISGDFNPIHMDHEFAKTTLFHQPIAHGLLVLSMASGLGLHSPPMRTLALLGFREWQFRGAVFIGDTIHARIEVLQKEPKPRSRRGVVHWQRQIINQAGKIVQEGISVTLVESRLRDKEKAEESHDAGQQMP